MSGPDTRRFAPADGPEQREADRLECEREFDDEEDEGDDWHIFHMEDDE